MNVRSAICWLLCVCMLFVGVRPSATTPAPVGECAPTCCGDICHCEPTVCNCKRSPDRDGRERQPIGAATKLAFAALPERRDLPRRTREPSRPRAPPAVASAPTHHGTIWRDRARHQVLGVLRI